MAQNVTISSLENIPIIAFNRGEARVATGMTIYVHHFEIGAIQNELQVLLKEFHSIEETQFTTIISEEFKTTYDTLGNILPSTLVRTKRWDTLGTIWKFIAGTPDANDLRLINSTLNDLITNNNAQIIINNDLTTRVKECLEKVKQSLSVFSSSTVELYALNIYINLKYLTEKLSIIVESITLAKLSITNPRLLSKKETDLIIANFKNSRYPLHTAIEALSKTTTKVAVNKNELLLMIRVPKLESRVYRKIQVYAITNRNKKVHVPNSLYLSIKSQMFTVSTLEDDIYLAENIEEDNSTCIPHLIKRQSAICDYVANPSKSEVINVNTGNIVISTDQWYILDSTCGIHGRNLTGSISISYDSCDILINKTMVSTQVIDIPGSPIHLPIFGIEVTPRNKVINLSIHYLHDLHNDLRKHMKQIKLDNNSLSWSWKWSVSSSISTPLLVLIIISVYVYLSKKKSNVKIQINAMPDTQTPQNNGTETSSTSRMMLASEFKPITMQELFRTEPQI
ncbi:uncharacterized protein LOC118503408 [Anopheles stephensi]|uniref:uncharacterized protein LOC118503408 n=1 Tax=Anopheles stephensi TaxID=30069 RepID=UPI001658718E|nr:uncharacterized protein LOC118503408 [Anopheles stephensi]